MSESQHLKLFNTMTRSLEPLKLQEAGKVSLYTCGLTVYSQPHIGNWAAYIYWDVLVRVLEAQGLEVTRVQNITDVGHLVSDDDEGEDKLEKGAKLEGTTAWQVAEKYTKIADHEAYDLLRLKRPTAMPKATDYITEQILFVQDLEKEGYTYIIDDGVYFDTSKLTDYGKLAKLDASGLQPGARVADAGKKNSTDFALWKLSPKDSNRDMQWDSPWGMGFPGWHLECSVMANELLGKTIDIHTGGIDHIPIHHTNEIAQSEAHNKQTFATTWLHNNHLKIDGAKLSKSLGNTYTLSDIASHGFSIMAFKLMILSKHYQTEGNFTWEILESFQNRYNHWSLVADLRWQLDDVESNIEPIKLLDDLNNNLDTPGALAAIDDYINKIETNASSRQTIQQFVDEIDQLLGISLGSEDITTAQKELITAREQARLNKDWGQADNLRNQLLDQGISLSDTNDSVRWFRTTYAD